MLTYLNGVQLTCLELFPKSCLIWTLRKGLLYQEEIRRKCKLVEEDKTKDEGIIMMANEGITIDNDMLFYLEFDATNHMCGNKHLFIDIQETKDVHVSFRYSTKHKDGKEGTMEDIYYVPDLENNILSIGRLFEKRCSIFVKDWILYLKDENGRVLAHMEMTKNRMFKINLKTKVFSLKLEGKVEDVEEVLKTFKESETHMVEMEYALNKAQFMAYGMKYGIFNFPVDEKSGVVVS